MPILFLIYLKERFVCYTNHNNFIACIPVVKIYTLTWKMWHFNQNLAFSAIFFCQGGLTLTLPADHWNFVASVRFLLHHSAAWHKVFVTRTVQFDVKLSDCCVRSPCFRETSQRSRIAQLTAHDICVFDTPACVAETSSHSTAAFYLNSSFPRIFWTNEVYCKKIFVV